MTLLKRITLGLTITLFSILLCIGCATPYDSWGLYFNTGSDSIAVLKLTLSSGSTIIEDLGATDRNGAPFKYFRDGITGRFPRPDHLSVTWQDTDLGTTESKQIDLKNLLPENLDQTRLALFFKNNKVYIFVVYLHEPPNSYRTNEGYLDVSRSIQISPPINEDRYHNDVPR